MEKLCACGGEFGNEATTCLCSNYVPMACAGSAADAQNSNTIAQLHSKFIAVVQAMCMQWGVSCYIILVDITVATLLIHLQHTLCSIWVKKICQFWYKLSWRKGYDTLHTWYIPLILHAEFDWQQMLGKMFLQLTFSSGLLTLSANPYTVNITHCVDIKKSTVFFPFSNYICWHYHWRLDKSFKGKGIFTKTWKCMHLAICFSLLQIKDSSISLKTV